RELVERIALAPPSEELSDDFGVDRRPARRHPVDRLDEVVDRKHAILEQVAEPLRMLAEQLQRVPCLDDLREQEHPDVWMLGADLDGGACALVGLRRRHPDVDDRDVGLPGRDCPTQRVGVADLGDDVDAVVDENVRNALPQEQGVVSDHCAHGISATTRVPPAAGDSTRSVPPSASTRSAIPWSPEPKTACAPPTPSSATSSSSSARSRRTTIDAFTARACFAMLFSASHATK